MSKQLTVTDSNLPVSAEEYEDAFGMDNLDDLEHGVSGGMGVISFRGSKWRIKFGGEETLITDSEGEHVASIPVVMVKASAAVSKLYYGANYEEGSDSAPDCFSLNGETPDPSAPAPQHDSCATCPHNMWGSRITDSGKKAKACNDNRRIAIVPAAAKIIKGADGKADAEATLEVLRNTEYSGPMLLRVPPASLKDLVAFSKELRKKHGANYNTIVTRIGFDPNTAYPKLTFKAVRPLAEVEKGVILDFIKDGSVDNVLGAAVDHAEAPVAKPQQAKTVDTDWENDEEEEAPAPKPEPAPKPARKKRTAKKAAVKAAPEPTPEPVVAAPAETEGDAIDDSLDDIMGELDALGG